MKVEVAGAGVVRTTREGAVAAAILAVSRHRSLTTPTFPLCRRKEGRKNVEQYPSGLIGQHYVDDDCFLSQFSSNLIALIARDLGVFLPVLLLCSVFCLRVFFILCRVRWFLIHLFYHSFAIHLSLILLRACLAILMLH